MNDEKRVSITILLPSGRLPLNIMERAHKLAEGYGFGIYLSNSQNLRLIDVKESDVEAVKESLNEFNVDYKAPGKFPKPKICVGKGHCNLGTVDTEELTNRILDRFGARKKTKAKFKIAVAACAMCCSNPKTTDIGVIKKKKGYDLFIGGKGGLSPKIGKRFAKNIDFNEILDKIEVLVEYHDRKTKKKQRMHKLLTASDFPFIEV